MTHRVEDEVVRHCEECGTGFVEIGLDAKVLAVAEFLRDFATASKETALVTVGLLERIEANQARLEKALKAHGVGAWGNGG